MNAIDQMREGDKCNERLSSYGAGLGRGAVYRGLSLVSEVRSKWDGRQAPGVRVFSGVDPRTKPVNHHTPTNPLIPGLPHGVPTGRA